jgi:hypothetical protein
MLRVLGNLREGDVVMVRATAEKLVLDPVRTCNPTISV